MKVVVNSILKTETNLLILSRLHNRLWRPQYGGFEHCLNTQLSLGRAGKSIGTPMMFIVNLTLLPLPFRKSRCVCMQSHFSCVWLCDPMNCKPATLLCPWGWSRQAYWSQLPCLPPGDLLDPDQTRVSCSSCTAGGFFNTEPPGKPQKVNSVQLLSRVRLFVTPSTAVHQASLSITNSCPLSWWCYPTISSSVIPFSSCLQSFPAPGSFPLSQFFASGGQIIGVSASASVLPMNIQDWFPLEWTGLISFQPKGLSRVFSNITIEKYQVINSSISSESQ